MLNPDSHSYTSMFFVGSPAGAPAPYPYQRDRNVSSNDIVFLYIFFELVLDNDMAYLTGKMFSATALVKKKKRNAF